MRQERSAVTYTFYNIFCSPKVATLWKQQAPEAANSESNEGHYFGAPLFLLFAVYKSNDEEET